jgi:hypothetical protein
MVPDLSSLDHWRYSASASCCVVLVDHLEITTIKALVVGKDDPRQPKAHHDVLLIFGPC